MQKVYEVHRSYPSREINHIYIGLWDGDRYDGIFDIEKDEDDLLIVIPDDSLHIITDFADFLSNLHYYIFEDDTLEEKWEQIFYAFEDFNITELEKPRKYQILPLPDEGIGSCL